MQWFSGPVSEAVRLARNDKKLFVVYIHGNSNRGPRFGLRGISQNGKLYCAGDNEASQQMNEVWEIAQVIT
jgi:hypothetical protein